MLCWRMSCPASAVRRGAARRDGSMWASGASGSWKEIGKDETIEGYFYGKPLSETPIEIRIYRLIDDMYDDGDLLSSDRIEVIHVEEEPAEETGDIGDGTEP